MFESCTEDEYAKIEDALEQYLRLTIRLILADMARDGPLTDSGGLGRMKSASVDPEDQPTPPSSDQ